MIVEAKILMGEIDTENAFDNSKSFYYICFHKIGIKNSFIYQIPKENITFNGKIFEKLLRSGKRKTCLHHSYC